MKLYSKKYVKGRFIGWLFFHYHFYLPSLLYLKELLKVVLSSNLPNKTSLILEEEGIIFRSLQKPFHLQKAWMSCQKPWVPFLPLVRHFSASCLRHLMPFLSWRGRHPSFKTSSIVDVLTVWGRQQTWVLVPCGCWWSSCDGTFNSGIWYNELIKWGCFVIRAGDREGVGSLLKLVIKYSLISMKAVLFLSVLGGSIKR